MSQGIRAGIAVVAVLFVAWASVAAAQQQSPPSKPAPKPAAKPAAPAAATKPQAAAPVTEKEAAELAKRIDTAAMKGDLSAFQAAMDDDEAFARATRGLQMRADTKAGFREGAQIAAALAKTIQAQVRENGASYRLVRVNVRDGRPMPLFRFISAQGLNYHEMHLYRDKQGKVRIADMMVFVIGETLSQNMRTGFSGAVAGDGTVKADEEHKAMVASTKTIAQIRQLLGQGKNEEAMALYEPLPAGVKAAKTTALLGVMIRSNLGDDAAYAAALDDYRRRFPDAADVDLVALDALFLRKDYDGVLAVVDRLDKRLGGDGYLNLFRGNATAAKGDADAARGMLRKALAAAPSVGAPYFALIELELGAKQFDNVGNALTAATRFAGIQWGDLETSEPFAEFVKSPAYPKWKAAQAGPAPQAQPKSTPKRATE